MNLIKGKCFWLLKFPSSTTWYWRKIPKLRELAKNFIKFLIGDGSVIFLWLENWHADGILVDKYGHSIVF